MLTSIHWHFTLELESKSSLFPESNPSAYEKTEYRTKLNTIAAGSKNSSDLTNRAIKMASSPV